MHLQHADHAFYTKACCVNVNHSVWPRGSIEVKLKSA